jgi:hypothetical protein
MVSITKKLLAQWSKNVGLNIEAQIRKYSEYVKNSKHKAPTPYQFKENI